MTGELIIDHEKNEGSKPVDAVKPFPPVAVEIIRLILELSGHFSNSTSASLMRVCKELQKWITPILYNKVLLENNKQIVAFNRTVRTSALGSNVRTLGIFCDKPIRSVWDVSWIAGLVDEVLSCCPQLEILADEMFLWHLSYHPYEQYHYPAPWQVIMEIDPLSLVIGHPLLRNLTHLHITNIKYTDPEEDGPNDYDIYVVLSIKTLTHVACNCPDQGSVPVYPSFVHAMKQVLGLPSLRMLLILIPFLRSSDKLVGPMWKALAEVEDERIFAQLDKGSVDPRSAILEPGATIWDDADIKYKDWRSQVRDTDEEKD